MKKRKNRYLILFIGLLFIFLLNSLTNSYSYAGKMTILSINDLDNEKIELILSNSDTGDVLVTLDENEVIDFFDSTQSNKYNNEMLVSEMRNYISTGEEYYIDINIVKFPLNLVMKNNIEYIRKY